MKDEIELLEYIHQSARIGQETIGRILVVKDIETKFDVEIKESLNNYKKIVYSAKSMLIRRKKKVRDITMGTKMAIYMSIKRSLSENINDELIANQICKYSEIALMELQDFVKETKIKSKTIQNLANRLIKYEEENIEKYNKYSKLMY